MPLPDSRDKKVVIANLTGHDLRLLGANGYKDYGTEGIARVESRMTTAYRAHANGIIIPVLSINEDNVVGLPDPIAGMLYVVSGLVASIADRDDVVAPGRVQRDRHGKVIGARALVRPIRGMP